MLPRKLLEFLPRHESNSETVHVCTAGGQRPERGITYRKSKVLNEEMEDSEPKTLNPEPLHSGMGSVSSFQGTVGIVETTYLSFLGDTIARLP